jgi:hypothetical protein
MILKEKDELTVTSTSDCMFPGASFINLVQNPGSSYHLQLEPVIRIFSILLLLVPDKHPFVS